MTRHEKRVRLARLKELHKRIEDEMTLLEDELSRLTPTGKRRSRFVIPPCGTESAYQRHRNRGEERDKACKAAHARYVKAWGLRQAARDRGVA